MVHKCAATGCNKLVNTNFLMCPAHWRMVPGDIQGRVLAAFKEYKDATRIGIRETVEASKKLREVQAEAVASI